MTWAEFNLRLFSYKRQTEREERNFREVGFAALWAFNSDPKHLPRTKIKYWPIGKESQTKSVLTDAARTAFAKAQEQYLKEINERKVKR